jgi:DNA primase
VPLPECASPEATAEDAEAGWWHIYGLLQGGALDHELAAARRDFSLRADRAAQRRLVALSAAREALRRGEQDEK